MTWPRGWYAVDQLISIETSLSITSNNGMFAKTNHTTFIACPQKRYASRRQVATAGEVVGHQGCEGAIGEIASPQVCPQRGPGAKPVVGG